VGGNVSLYNETRGHDIDPTPVVGVLGIVDSLVRRPPGRRLVAGRSLIQLGPTVAPSLAGSRWAWQHGAKGGGLPALDLAGVARLAAVVRALVDGDLLVGVHDVADGGLAAAVAEMVASSGVGAWVPDMSDHPALFAESPERVVVCVDPAAVERVVERAEEGGIGTRVIGETGGDRLRLGSLVDVAVDDVVGAWRQRLPEVFGTAVAH
jgi:phosphoribosylformylglycinamidine synthase